MGACAIKPYQYTHMLNDCDNDFAVFLWLWRSNSIKLTNFVNEATKRIYRPPWNKSCSKTFGWMPSLHLLVLLFLYANHSVYYIPICKLSGSTSLHFGRFWSARVYLCVCSFFIFFSPLCIWWNLIIWRLAQISSLVWHQKGILKKFKYITKFALCYTLVCLWIRS